MTYIFKYKNRLTTNQMGFDTIEINLVYVSKAYIPNLGPLGPLLHVEKFVVVVVVVVVGGWWVVGV